ncbi:MAG: hypothetical protein BWY78_00044 [Alphaproteobacteria bacterium ADurb.Bin438]|nr:MAG: hypothetical protein BWY78_00044 [Alphaproteobacteria bacterium ADurb.Bin438]
MDYNELLTKVLNEFAFPLINAFLLALIPIITYKINAWLTAKTGIETNLNLDIIGQRAVAYAEEWALSKAKNVKPSGNEKLNEAIKFIMLHTPSISKEKAEKLAIASLNKLKLGASSKK